MPELKGRVADAFEARVREHEEAWLSPHAVRSYETRGRDREEAFDLTQEFLARLLERNLLSAADPLESLSRPV